jgi:hypothetical protein
MADSDKICFVSLTVNLQGMTVDRRNHGNNASKHFGGKAHGRYMASIGAERIFSLFDELGLKSTVFVPGAEAEEHPDLVKALAGRGHEIAAHGYAHEDYTAAAGDRDLIRKTHAVLTELTGIAPAGWRAPTGVLEHETLTVLSDLGYAYDASNQDDDFPYHLDRDGGRGMIELPQQEMLIDKELYERRATHQKLMKWWRQEFKGLYDERCYVQLTVTPRADYGSARASRIAELRSFLREIAALENVEIGTCGDALAAIRSGRLFCRQ